MSEAAFTRSTLITFQGNNEMEELYLLILILVSYLVKNLVENCVTKSGEAIYFIDLKFQKHKSVKEMKVELLFTVFSLSKIMIV